VREKEKVWVPWNGLIVIGKRVELLDRNVQKSNPKLESEDWKLEGTGKKFSREKSGLQQEAVVAKLLSSVRRAVQARASLEYDSPEIWRELEDRLKAGVTTSAEMTAERGENLKSRDRLRTTGGDLRSRGDQLRPNEELESSGENLKKRVPIGDKVVGRGEKRRSSAEKMDSRERRGSIREKTDSEEKRGSIREKATESRQRRGSIREKVSDSGERRGSIREKMSDSGERRGSIREKMSDSGERRGSIREKISDTRERRGSIREKVSDSGERRGSIREKAKLSREKFRSSGEKLRTGDKNSRSTEDLLESNIEELESAEVQLKEHSRTGSASEETIERVVSVTGGEGEMENLSQEIPSESVEGMDGHGGAKTGAETDSHVLDGMREIADASVPKEEQDTLGESPKESGG
jgi:chromosome segregation ATPase